MNIGGKEIRKVLCLGVGGVGVGPIAECLLNLGIAVVGYDGNDNAICVNLRKLGAHITTNDDINLLAADVDAVVYSSAISLSHPILQAATERGLVVMRRAGMLGELLRLKYGIGVAGTHGKTTTSAMTAYLLFACEQNPSWVVGGKLANTNNYMHWSDGEYLVVEADESDGSLIELHPKVAVFTNCESDHLINFANDFAKLQDLYLQFLQQLPQDGWVVVNKDDEIAVRITAESGKKSVSFGFVESADYVISEYEQTGLSASFNLALPGGEVQAINLQVPGLHNVYNATAAFVTAHQLGVAAADLSAALANFKGVGRRFTICGDYAMPKGTVTVVNDYGHHPTEVDTTIAAAKASYPGRRVVVVFEPHRFTRTQEHFPAFVTALEGADVLLIPKTFTAGEELIPGYASMDLVQAIEHSGHKNVQYIGDIANTLSRLQEITASGDIVILLGAGTVGYLVDKWEQAGLVVIN